MNEVISVVEMWDWPLWHVQQGVDGKTLKSGKVGMANHDHRKAVARVNINSVYVTPKLLLGEG